MSVTKKTKVWHGSLDDKYQQLSGRVWMSGVQALVRLPMLQKILDEKNGLNTAGFISGYRGSPLGTLDHHLWQAQKYLDQHEIVFKPGVNEDLAATAVWGSQQLNLYPNAKYQGVFAMWYGKGPGVDRSTDVLKHANAAGSSRLGGVLTLAGDDHAARSSTLPHQSDHIFKASGIPVLYPSSVQEYIEYGLHGWAMSRYAGVWVALKCVTDIVESSASVEIDIEQWVPVEPTDYVMPAEGLNIRWPDTPLEQEKRLLQQKLYAALAYVRANRLNRLVYTSQQDKIGIISAGKAYLDTRQALVLLGLSEEVCAQIGIRLFKIAMIWPLEPQTTREFAEGLDEIIVVEEKRQIIEYQLKEELFAWASNGQRVPRVVGKFDEKEGGEWAIPHSEWTLPTVYELNPSMIAKLIARRLLMLNMPDSVSKRLQDYLDMQARAERSLLLKTIKPVDRQPWFCSGCPHNTSTKIPEGSRGMAGIGCHYMVLWMDRQTSTFTQMGGEGVPWIGQQPFTNEKHVFANLGDGTYFHSGYLAIRAAVAAKVPITYKILFNDAVAMTGGQAVDGSLSLQQLIAQVQAEGVKKVVLVSDDIEKYQSLALASSVMIFAREELDNVQRDLREYPDVSVLIYDQVCATEKRRRRKRGKLEDPKRRIVINPSVCEGCGDCSTQSNCLSVEPLLTPLGVKRHINQSSCNKDFSCVKGFCPSFVMLEGAELSSRQRQPKAPQIVVPEPISSVLARNDQEAYTVLVAGVGGTGVVTLGQLLGMAAHIEGKYATALDMTGLAQKGGAVFSHVVISKDAEEVHSTRVVTEGANLLLAGDAIVASGHDALSRLSQDCTHAVINDELAPTAGFIKDRNWSVPKNHLASAIQEHCASSSFFNASRLSEHLFGDSVYANAMLVGFAYQKGYIPLSAESIKEAVSLNGAAVANNHLAFDWGRAYAVDPSCVPTSYESHQEAELSNQEVLSLPELMSQFVGYLVDYQNTSYAQSYQSFIQNLGIGESPEDVQLAKVVARNLYKLMAIKDEYEVARLHTDGGFWKQLAAEYQGEWKPIFYFSIPYFGKGKKQAFGSFIKPFLKMLSVLKVIRNTPLDVFSYQADRRMEQKLLQQYKDDVLTYWPRRADMDLELMHELFNLPDEVKGFGHIKVAAIEKMMVKREKLLEKIRLVNR